MGISHCFKFIRDVLFVSKRFTNKNIGRLLLYGVSFIFYSIWKEKQSIHCFCFWVTTYFYLWSLDENVVTLGVALFLDKITLIWGFARPSCCNFGHNFLWSSYFCLYWEAFSFIFYIFGNEHFLIFILLWRIYCGMFFIMKIIDMLISLNLFTKVSLERWFLCRRYPWAKHF